MKHTIVLLLILSVAGLVAQTDSPPPVLPSPPLPTTTATNAAEVAIAHIAAVEAARIESEKKRIASDAKAAAAEDKLSAANQNVNRLINTLHRGEMGATAALMPPTNFVPYIPDCLTFTPVRGRTNHWIVTVKDTWPNVHIVASQGTNSVVVKSIEVKSE